jgi:8-oxo-dGTP pyrophosphatase MutT (NUDIX family)
MNYEYSCGAVVFTRKDGVPHYLLIRQNDQCEGCHGFPKGHMEPGETEYMTAIREVFEETAVQIRIDSKFRETVHYSPMPGVSKEVVYFLTHTAQKEIRAREGEIAQVEWVPLDQVEASLTHENDKVVFRAAMKVLKAETVNQKA